MAPFIRQEVHRLGRRARSARRAPQAAVVWGIDPDLVDAVQPLSRYLLPDPAVLAALDGGTCRA